jgi:hypothetical protein
MKMINYAQNSLREVQIAVFDRERKRLLKLSDGGGGGVCTTTCFDG